MALASVLMARYAAFGLLPAAVGALVVALACGVFNGLTITVGRVQPLIATLAMMGIARGLAFSVTEKSLLVANPIIGQIGRFGGFISVPTPVWGIWRSPPRPGAASPGRGRMPMRSAATKPRRGSPACA